MISISSILDVNDDDIQRSFDEIAENIFKLFLKVNNTLYSIVEIEMYYYSEKHPDSKTLSRTRNKGELYFHDYGVDICFQSDGKANYGGILLRSIKSVSDEVYINGPLKVSQAILNNIVINQPFTISFTHDENKNKNNFLRYARIVADDPNNDFIESPYRYAVETINGKNKVKYKTMPHQCS